MATPISKLLLWIVNSVFMVISFIMAVIGAVLTYVPGKALNDIYDNVKNTVPHNAEYTIPKTADGLNDVPFFSTLGFGMFVFGVCLFTIAFMAYLGVCCTSCCRFMLVLYSVLLVLFVIIELAVGIMFFAPDSPLHDMAKKRVKGLITDKYQDNGTDDFSESLNLLHIHYDCCGIDGVKDFGNKLHRSCNIKVENDGCYSKIQEDVEANIAWCVIGLASLVALQLLEMYCAIAVHKDNIRKKIRPIKRAD